MKKSVLFRFALICLCGFPAIAGNIVFNPGFEDSGGSLNGWTTPGGGWFVDTFTANSGPHSVRTPCVGASCLAPTGGGLYQDLTTIPGETYTLTFFVNFILGSTPNELQVYWGGSQVDDIVNNTTFAWQQFMVNGLTAPTGTTRLEFFGRDDINNVNLDDISVTSVSAVPEPTVGMTVSAGLLLAAALRRLRLV